MHPLKLFDVVVVAPCCWLLLLDVVVSSNPKSRLLFNVFIWATQMDFLHSGLTGRGEEKHQSGITQPKIESLCAIASHKSPTNRSQSQKASSLKPESADCRLQTAECSQMDRANLSSFRKSISSYLAAASFNNSKPVERLERDLTTSELEKQEHEFESKCRANSN